MRLDGSEVRHYWSDRVRRQKGRGDSFFFWSFIPDEDPEASYCTDTQTRPLLLARNWIRRHYASSSPSHSFSFPPILSVFLLLPPPSPDDGNNLDAHTATLYVLIVFPFAAAHLL